MWFPIGKFDNKNNYKNYNFDRSVMRIKKAEDDYSIARF